MNSHLLSRRPVGVLIDLSGKVALVTGSSQGIGAEIARRLHEAGATIVLNQPGLDSTKADAEQVAAELNAKRISSALVIDADVTKEEAVQAMMQRIANEVGGLDILVNNAAILRDRTLAKMTLEEWQAVIDVNLTGVFLCCKHGLEVLRDGGAIVSLGTCEEDEHPRADTTLEKLSALRPAFRPDGTVTAGNSSGINDGAAMLLLASSSEASKRNLSPRARIAGASVIGCDPATMGLGPVFAIRALLADLGWALSDVPVVEINEAFAAQVLACQKELGLSDAQLNLRGGGIALGHPIGCSGSRVLVTLLHLMEDLNVPRGIAALCVGGGLGVAMALER